VKSLENALRRFQVARCNRKTSSKEIKKHSFYMKPGEEAPGKKAAFAEATAQEAAAGSD